MFKLKKKIWAAASTFALAGGIVAIAALPAAADNNFFLELDGSYTDPVWSFTVRDAPTPEPICDEPAIQFISSSDPNPGDISDSVTINDDRLSGSLDVTALPGGYNWIAFTCETDNPDVNNVYETEFAFGRVIVEKVVEGDAPDDSVFVVNIDDNLGDSGVQYDLQFSAAGGTQTFFAPWSGTFTVTETDDGGAESSQVEGQSVVLDLSEGSVEGTATVTNVFPSADPDLQPDPEDAPDAAPEPLPTDESDPATPVVLKPAVTG